MSWLLSKTLSSSDLPRDPVMRDFDIREQILHLIECCLAPEVEVSVVLKSLPDLAPLSQTILASGQRSSVIVELCLTVFASLIGCVSIKASLQQDLQGFEGEASGSEDGDGVKHLITAREKICSAVFTAALSTDGLAAPTLKELRCDIQWRDPRGIRKWLLNMQVHLSSNLTPLASQLLQQAQVKEKSRCDYITKYADIGSAMPTPAKGLQPKASAPKTPTKLARKPAEALKPRTAFEELSKPISEASSPSPASKLSDLKVSHESYSHAPKPTGAGSSGERNEPISAEEGQYTSTGETNCF